MAEASSADKKEQEFFTRVTLALTDCGTQLLYHLLLQRIRELTPKDSHRQPWSIDEFLYHNVKDILICIGKDKIKTNILYPGFEKKPDLSKWDIPLYVFVLLNACELDNNDAIHRQLIHELGNIRNIRNKMQHKGNPTLEEAIYQRFIARIVGAVERICDYIQEPRLKEKLLKKLEKYSSLGHIYPNDVISETGCKSVDIINESDAAVESGLQEMKTIIEKKRLTVDIPVMDVMVMFRNYNKENEHEITVRLLDIFSKALEDGTERTAERASNELDGVVKSLVRKLFDEKKEITKVSKGCLVLSIRCHNLDAVISLIQDSLSGKLEKVFEPLEDLIRTDADHERFEVYVGITRQTCWALFNDIFCQVLDKCDHRRFTVESAVQDDGIVVRIQGFLQNAIVKENLEKSFSSKVKQEIRKTIKKKLVLALDQPRMDMILLSPKLHEEEEVEEKTTGSASKEITFGLEEKKKTKGEKDVSHIPVVTKPKKMPGSGGWKREKTMEVELLQDRVEVKEKSRPSLIKIKGNDREKLQAVVDKYNYQPDISDLRDETSVLHNRMESKEKARPSLIKGKNREKSPAVVDKSNYQPDISELKDETLETKEKTRPSLIKIKGKDKENSPAVVVKLKYEPDISELENETKADCAPTVRHKNELDNMELLDKNGKGEFGSIFGLTVVNDKYLVAADNWKLCLRCFDIDSRKQKCMYELELEPWDITTIAGNRVAVTTSAHQVWVLCVTGNGALLLENKINVDRRCYGIASCGDNLIVSYEHPDPGVEILDMRGNVIKVFVMDEDHKELFQFPDYLAVSPDLSTIYISDFDKDTLTICTLDGLVVGVVKDEENIDDPRNVTVDSAGRVYVCCQKSHTVSWVSPKTGTVTKLLGIEDNVMWPRCVAICDKRGCIFLGMGDNNVIKIFKNII
ncbi:uncharacterized protein LOC128206414 isoform X2 [Mya arenaria]|uniref:uncharacterized protein LOC128206414 isoform X2 n=1 Tax=Mya arenaria TaxID=6604 RepID=UPI0022DFF627|nr:uncharacterized protein LOC128206414 isoform X2 [Mya arenaria]